MIEERHEQMEQRQRVASENADAKLARMDKQIAILLSGERRRRATNKE